MWSITFLIMTIVYAYQCIQQTRLDLTKPDGALSFELSIRTAQADIETFAVS